MTASFHCHRDGSRCPGVDGKTGGGQIQRVLHIISRVGARANLDLQHIPGIIPLYNLDFRGNTVWINAGASLKFLMRCTNSNGLKETSDTPAPVSFTATVPVSVSDSFPCCNSCDFPFSLLPMTSHLLSTDCRYG